MLVLSRKRQQAIVIGDTDGSGQTCRVTILEIRGGTVRLGIEVDDHILVLRSEIADRPGLSTRSAAILNFDHAQAPQRTH